MFLAILTGCTSYTVSKVSENQVMVSKTTQILCFWGSSVYTCNLDKDGLLDICEDNNIQTEEEILKKQEQLRLEQERKQRLNQSSFSEPSPIIETIAPKPEIIKTPPAPIKRSPKRSYRDLDKSKIYLGLGLSTSGDNVEDDHLETAKFNYSFAYLLKEKDFMYGAIYHVSAHRVYGSIPNPNQSTQRLAYQMQANINLLGATFRKYASSTNETSPYLRLDTGLAWVTTGESLILGPFQDSQGFGIGGNLGVGLAFKTDFGSINLDIFHTLYKSSEVPDLKSGMTNFTIGLMF